MTATSNIPLNVSFKEKDEAKSLGARWNPEGKHWYVPEGVDLMPFKKWLADANIAVTAPAIIMTNQTKPNVNKTAEPLPANAEMDDINAMLRDAYELNEDD